MPVYVTDKAASILARKRKLTRDEMNPAEAEIMEDMLRRIKDVENSLAVVIMRGDTDGDGGTTCHECLADNDDEQPARNVEVLKSEITPGVMGVVYGGDELPAIADINKKNAVFWAARTGATAGGGPEATPAPGTGEEAKAQNFQPGAAKSISNPRRLSVTQKSLDMGKTGSWSTDGVPNANFYKALDSATNSTIARINAKNAAAYGRR